MNMNSLMARTCGRALYDPFVRGGKRVPPLLSVCQGLVNRSRIVRLPEGHPLVSFFSDHMPTTSYSGSRSTLIWLWAHLERTRPKRLMEMGSGLSTLMLARYLDSCGTSTCLHSVDHSPQWHQQTSEMLKKIGLDRHVRLELAPIVDAPSGCEWGPGYQIREWGGSYDFALIDGPPSSCGRLATLPSLWERLEIGADVFVDDAERDGERAAMNKWLTRHKTQLKLVEILPLGKGLAWLKKTA